MKKMLAVFFVMALMATPAFAGEQPEYDVVGCDANAYFNSFINEIVCECNQLGGAGLQINKYSNFTDDCDNPFNAPGQLEGCNPLFASGFWEFWSGPGQARETSEICFECPEVPTTGPAGAPDYYTKLVGTGNGGTFKWQIVIQKKPETDLDLNIHDCVVKMNSQTMYGDAFLEGAGQTGWYFAFDDFWVWMVARNPRISIEAVPGVSPVAGFEAPFFMDAKVMPGLGELTIDDVLYTTKALWDETIIIKKPETGEQNVAGDDVYTLRQGDRILITVVVPDTNTVDVRYGMQAMVLKYIGIHGEEFVDVESADNASEGDILCSDSCDNTDAE
jgi:hypothetical protein